jgi:uncharacterized protein (DUF1015 family)
VCDNRLTPTRSNFVPTFEPFRGLRYAPTAIAGVPALDRLVAPPYDVIDRAQRDALAAHESHNAVALILPAGDDDTRYAHAAELIADWRSAGVLALDPTPTFTVNRMSFTDEDGSDRVTVGVLGALTLPETPHSEGSGPATAASVLPHERTLPKAKSDRLALLRATRVNLDPIWGLAPTTGLTAALVPDRPADASATDEHGVRHETWTVADDAGIGAIRNAIAPQPLVLADGHHRFETAINLRNERRAAGEHVPGDDAIMCFVVELADDALCVRSINRIVHDLAPDVDLRAALADDGAFAVDDFGANTPERVVELRQTMAAQGAIGLVDRDGLALLRPLAARAATDAAWPAVVAGVDAAVFETAIAPDLATATIEYRNDEAYAAALVDKGAASAAFLLRPVTVAQTRAASLAGVRMPQKTTFFYPKPRTGFVFRGLDD